MVGELTVRYGDFCEFAFLIFLAHVIKYLESLCTALGEGIDMPDNTEQESECWMSAAKTKFEYIKK